MVRSIVLTEQLASLPKNNNQGNCLQILQIVCYLKPASEILKCTGCDWFQKKRPGMQRPFQV